MKEASTVANKKQTIACPFHGQAGVAFLKKLFYHEN